MRTLLLVLTLVAINTETGFAYKRSTVRKRAAAVAFFDEDRLDDLDGRAKMENFEFFLKQVREIVARDFPDVEFRVVSGGELLRLPDGTGLNVQNMQPQLGYVLAARGKKRRVLSGLQSESDFACAASAFFRRPSPACHK